MAIIKRPLKWLYYQYFCIRNRRIDYFNYKKLSKEVKPYAWPLYSAIVGNACYGNKRILKYALGKSFHNDCMIEHGLYFAEYVLSDECTIPCIDTIYTYSDYRRNSILKRFKGCFSKEIITVGPYIQYAKNFKTELELKEIKDKFGKILLVFPSHDYPGNGVSFDEKDFISVIEEMSSKYDSVFVSMSGYDISQNHHKVYLNKGYTIVSSGTRFDPYFLNRQRDLIELADMTMSNSVGTHVGYCICLNRPHYIYNQEISSTGLLAEEKTNQDIRSREYSEIKKVFSSRTEAITQEQIDIVKHYWGTFQHSSLLK